MRNRLKSFMGSRGWFFLLCLLCLCFMLLSAFSSRTGGPFRVVAGYTVIPMQKGLNRTGHFLRQIGSGFATTRELQDENSKLKARIDELMIENNNLQEEKYELDRLRRLYDLDKSYADYEKTAAHVIGRDGGNLFDRFVIDKGENDGISKDMNVLSGSGLAGIVTEVGPTWAKVRSVIDDESNISAMTLNTSERCIVTGDLTLMQEGKIAFSQMKNSDSKIEAGDQVVTSSISDKYLQGILIGYISEVRVDGNNLTRSGYLTPAVDFSNLQEVLVITKTKSDMTGKKEE